MSTYPFVSSSVIVYVHVPSFISHCPHEQDPSHFILDLIHFPLQLFHIWDFSFILKQLPSFIKQSSNSHFPWQFSVTPMHSPLHVFLSLLFRGKHLLPFLHILSGHCPPQGDPYSIHFPLHSCQSQSSSVSIHLPFVMHLVLCSLKWSGAKFSLSTKFELRWTFWTPAV